MVRNLPLKDEQVGSPKFKPHSNALSYQLS